MREALASAKRVVVLEKALAVGIGGIVTANVRMALAGIELQGYTVIAGLGGRAITKASLRNLFLDAVADRLEPLTFLDMDWEIVNRELARMGASRTSGPHAENMLRTSGPSRRDRYEEGPHVSAPTIRFYQTGQLRGRQPPARPRAAIGPGRRGAHQLDHLRPPRLPGLRRGARRPLRARRRDARDRRTD